MPIIWTDFFDHIYCLHYLPAKHKLPRLIEEFQRTGILDSRILSLHETIPSPYDAVIYEKYKDPVCCPSPVFVNICLEIRKILYLAMDHGYQRILLLEDDVAFLKDLKELRRLLALTPKGYGVVQYDKFINKQFVSDYQRRIKVLSINENYFDGYHGAYTSAACIGLFDDGIKAMFDTLNAYICATDIAYQVVDCKYAIAKKNLAVQVMYKGAQSIDTVGINLIDEVYANAGIHYEDYAVPYGYTYGCILDGPGKVVSVNPLPADH